MSRSFHSPRHRFLMHAAHKRARHAVAGVLLAHTRRPVMTEAMRLVLADDLEERGLLAQAEALRHEDEDDVLPRVPGGFSTRLRW